MSQSLNRTGARAPRSPLGCSCYALSLGIIKILEVRESAPFQIEQYNLASKLMRPQSEKGPCEKMIIKIDHRWLQKNKLNAFSDGLEASISILRLFGAYM
uniref:Uncharacterized protein n=1 Tax=Romanomermis culicivorax TaxID=13658 RepID=A0A915IP83_ROMCU